MIPADLVKAVRPLMRTNSKMGKPRGALIWCAKVCATALICALLNACYSGGNGGDQRRSKTINTIKILDNACRLYKSLYAVYPESNGMESSVLHWRLGARRIANDGSGSWKPPLVEFLATQLELQSGNSDTYPNPPVNIIDGWGNRIRYKMPGSHNTDAFDIWSFGKDGIDDSGAKGSDDICNW